MKTRTKVQTIGLLCSIVAGTFALPTNAAQSELPYTTVSRYNVGGQLTGTIGPDPDGAGQLGYPATRYNYGTNGATRGLLLSVESGELTIWFDETIEPADWGAAFTVFVTTEYTYDAFARKASERVNGTNLATESLIEYSYDDWDRVRCKAVRMEPTSYGTPSVSVCAPGVQGSFGSDRVFRYSYDHFDQVLTEERAVGTSLHQTYVTNTYAGRGVLTSQRDANGNRTDLRYDSDWRLDRRVYPSPSAPGSVNEADFNEYDYDNNGNVTWERKRNGTSIMYSIDANNRRTFKHLSDNTHSADVSYDYDLRGLTLSSRFGSDAGQGITNAFDGFGRLASATTNMGGISRTLTYRYDANGNRTRVTHPDQWSFEYGFDGLDRISALGESTSASSGASVSTMLTLDYHRGGGRWHLFRPGGATTEYLQDNVKRLESFSQNFSGTTNDLINSFAYNASNQITFLSRSNDLYSISGVVSRTGAYVPNGLNQYTSVAGQTISYDTNGNLTNDGSISYAYDMENRLVSTGGSASSSFIYDPLGRLFQVTLGGTTRQFLYDGDALVAEYSGSTMTRRYVHGDQVDEPWVQYDSATVGASYRRYLHADHQGSIIAQSSDTGGVVFRNAYDAYGIPATGNTGRFGYTGQAWLPELGLYHYKARMYHPKLGRFLQTDPIFYADDMNMYAYVGGDPVNSIDPTGEWGVLGAVYGAVAGATGGFIASGGSLREKVIGTVSGAVAGAAVGVLAPHTSHLAGMAIAGAAASAAGQAIGSTTNAAIDKGVSNVSLDDVKIDPVTTVAGGLGAGAGGLVGRGVASMTAQPIVGNTIQAAGTPTAAGLTAGAVAEGAVIGAAETAAPKVVDAANGAIERVKQEMLYQ